MKDRLPFPTRGGAYRHDPKTNALTPEPKASAAAPETQATPTAPAKASRPSKKVARGKARR